MTCCDWEHVGNLSGMALADANPFLPTRDILTPGVGVLRKALQLRGRGVGLSLLVRRKTCFTTQRGEIMFPPLIKVVYTMVAFVFSGHHIEISVFVLVLSSHVAGTLAVLRATQM